MLISERVEICTRMRTRRGAQARPLALRLRGRDGLVGPTAGHRLTHLQVYLKRKENKIH